MNDLKEFPDFKEGWEFQGELSSISSGHTLRKKEIFFNKAQSA